MKYGLSNNSLNAIVSILERNPYIEAAFLYGSRAKGNYRTASDIDIVLKGERLGLGNLTAIINELDDLLLPYQFDVSIYHHINNPELLDHISRIGVNLLTETASGV